MADDIRVDLEDVIADSVNDAQIEDSEPAKDAVTDDTPVEETSAESTTSEETESANESATEEVTSQEVPSPAAGKEETIADEFEKLAGPSTGFGGRENRIPYSRVKKITEKAVSEIAEAALGRKLNQGEKALDVVKSHVAQIPELTTKVIDYEKRLETVGQFEDVMANDPQRFLTMLSKVPAYGEFFQFVNHAYETLSKQQGQETPAANVQEQAVQNVAVGMPEPDEELADGSKVYSIEGLQKVLDWKAAQVVQQVESRLTKQFEEKNKALEQRYTPMEQEWRERRRLEAARPYVEKQLAEAKTWPLFNENEDEIADFLAKNPKANLEQAYRSIVFPKLLAERSQVKKDVIKEMQTAPTSTSVPNRASTKPVAPKAGPKTLEDVIREQVATLK